MHTYFHSLLCLSLICNTLVTKSTHIRTLQSSAFLSPTPSQSLFKNDSNPSLSSPLFFLSFFSFLPPLFFFFLFLLLKSSYSSPFRSQVIFTLNGKLAKSKEQQYLIASSSFFPDTNFYLSLEAFLPLHSYNPFPCLNPIFFKTTQYFITSS